MAFRFMKVSGVVLVLLLGGSAFARYLQPEPVLRNPRAQVAMAFRGYSMPVYSYAANNPLHFIDRTGRVFESSVPAFWQSLSRMSMNPNLAPYLDAMQRSPTVFEFIYEPTPLNILKKMGGGYTHNDREANQCGGRPKNVYSIVNYPLAAKANWDAERLQTTFDQLVAHELGEAWGQYLGDGSEHGMEWENAMRVPGPYRMTHE